MNGIARLRLARRIDLIGRIAVALFCVRAAVPVGYMPASLADGGPFVLCKGASAATLAILDSHRAMHAPGAHADPPGQPPQGHDTRWEHCPLGVGAADTAPGPACNLPSIEPVTSSRCPAEPTSVAWAPVAAFRARGPPIGPIRS